MCPTKTKMNTFFYVCKHAMFRRNDNDAPNTEQRMSDNIASVFSTFFGHVRTTLDRSTNGSKNIETSKYI